MAAAIAPTPSQAPQLIAALPTGREDDVAVRDNPDEEVGSRDDTGAWGVQVGAYSTEVRAQRSIATARGLLPSLLSDTEGKVEPLTNRDVPIYRARLIGLLEKDARSVCLDLKRRKLPCVPVPAGG